MILFVNACVRKNSRTKRLADRLLAILHAPVTELCLADYEFPAVDEAFLEKRDTLKEEGDFSGPIFALASQFAAADEIVIAAPFWDLSFPAALKQYFEQINVGGVTFCYTAEGALKGLCRAKKLYYVTTAGGDLVPSDYGFGYVKALAQNFYGIQDVELIKATGLDIVGADVEQLMLDCEADIVRRFAAFRETTP